MLLLGRKSLPPLIQRVSTPLGGGDRLSTAQLASLYHPDSLLLLSRISADLIPLCPPQDQCLVLTTGRPIGWKLLSDQWNLCRDADRIDIVAFQVSLKSNPIKRVYAYTLPTAVSRTVNTHR